MSYADVYLLHTISLWRIGAFLLLGVTVMQAAAPATARRHALPATQEARLYVDYSSHPDREKVRAHNVIVLDPAAALEIKAERREGQVFLAYIPVVETSPGTPPAKAAQARGIPTLDTNEAWSSQVRDVTHPQWESYVMEDLIAPVLAKGYDGFFLDTLDSVEKITTLAPSKSVAARRAVSRLIRRLRAAYPKAPIVLNRAWEWAFDLAKDVDGVLIESLFQGWNGATKSYQAQPTEDTQWLLQRIKRLQTRRLRVFVLDYVAPSDLDLAAKTAKRIRALGCVPFISTPNLQGADLAPAERKE